MTGKELKAKLKELRMTQAELAEKLDVKENTVYRWANDRLPISRTVELAIKAVECGKG
ncbi:MAG: helix-turn-helix domain-containing protein [Acidobacteriota bacterium]|jgi:transcriptional regulator with XRE-family HTH domain|nr:helix-turn-helix domain-containing protein [Acidobacteriota bacterium]